MAMEGHTADSEYTSGTESEGSFTSGTGSPTSDMDSSADGSSLVVAPHFYRAASVTRSQSTASPPPVKHLKLESGRRDRVKTPGGKTAHKGPRGIAESAVTPPKVVRGQKKSGKSSSAEKGAILPGGRDATASTVVIGQETTARVSAQEGSNIVTCQETTARVSAQEGSSIVTGQETTAGVSAQEGPGSHSPAGQ
ncbi:hypothetical protein NDU88_000736 [Pleurodeles waltl]|uniref:Uncharacterized protein n=1 Tax=Pleurodeles waltl TaxID=8319 RepID=A0AAV7SXD3_PLEWA|nr:hypothetical protein NDU88_000736 [Pleurodeles waltl]